jgi:hypothetical protein
MTAVPVSLESFDGKPFPADVTATILNSALTGAPVFDSLTRRTTSRAEVAFPTADPTGFDWVAELGTIPTVDTGDDAAVVSPAKIAGNILLSLESVSDTDLNITAEVGRLIRESMTGKADTDLVYGVADNTAAPAGFFDLLPPAEGATLRAAVVDACAQILGAGGNPTTVLISPALWSAEVTRRETVPAGSGLLSDLGIPLAVKVAATLKATDALVLDQAGCFGVVRNDYTIEGSIDAPGAWDRDAVALRVKARLAAVVPAPSKHARSVTVTPGD